MAGKRWSTEENECLTRLWDSTLTLEEVAANFENRTPASIRVQARRLGLRHTPEQFREVLSKKVRGERNGMHGRPSPRRGVLVSDETRAKLRESARTGFAEGRRERLLGERNPMYGKPSPMRGKNLSVEARESIGEQASLRWAQRSHEDRAQHLIKMRQGWVRWVEQRLPTSIEILIETWLQEMQVDFTKQVVVGHYIVDFVVGHRVVETFGDYWHGNPTHYTSFDRTQRANQRRDRAKATYLERRGRPLLVLWEHDLKTTPEACRTRLAQFLGAV